MTTGNPGDLEQKLRVHGLTVVERSSDGPMGSAEQLFTDGFVDVSIFDDRGDRGVSIGVRCGTTYEIQVWCRVLGLIPSPPSDLDEQLDWAFNHLADVRGVVENDVRIAERLQSVNWELVKERLGLNPDADRDDPSTWHGSQ